MFFTPKLKPMKKLFISLFAVSLIATGCAADSTSDTAAAPDAAETSEAMPDDMEGMDMKGMESSSEGDFEFSLVSPEPPVATGDAEFVVAVKDAATGEPAMAEDLAVDVYMEMDGAEKMATESEVSAGSEPGTYTVKTYLSMAGPWVVHAVVDGEKAGVGHMVVEAQ